MTRLEGVSPSMRAGADPSMMAQLTDLAERFRQRLRDLPEELDPGWRSIVESRAMGMLLEPGPTRERVVARLFVVRCGQLKSLSRLLDPMAQLALLGRRDVLKQLGALAVARRPGVLRSCIDGKARNAMRELLGETFDRVADARHGGMPVPHAFAHMSPVQWASIGYLDWLTLMQPGDREWRGLVRLCLPPALCGARFLHRRAPPEIEARRAWALVSTASRQEQC